MRTTNFDAIAAAVPLDSTASVVRDSVSRDVWTASIPPDIQHWSAPPLPAKTLRCDVEDLSGRLVGRMRVVRFHGATANGKPGPLWLVRCPCGDYEVRRTTTVLNNANPDACCFVCTTVEKLRRQGASRPTKGSREADSAMLDRFARSDAA